MARRAGVLVGTYATQHEAAQALQELQDSRLTDRYNLTFAQVYGLWRTEKDREVTDRSAGAYASSYEHCKALSDRRYRDIAPSEFQAVIIRAEKTGKAKSTCEKIRSLLRMMGDWAVREGIVGRNPAQDLTVTAQQKTEREPFTDAEIDRIRRSSARAADIALLLIACGARPGEVFRVPLESCHDSYIIGGSKTAKGRNRVIPVGPLGLDAYRRLRDRAAASGGKLLIDGYAGNKTLNNFAKRDWVELMQEIGCAGRVPYCCRHTFVTRSIRAGMSLPVLEDIVGHLDRETTKLYTHLRAGDLVAAVGGESKCNKSVTSLNVVKSDSA